jgi:hypothetical protein
MDECNSNQLSIGLLRFFDSSFMKIARRHRLYITVIHGTITGYFNQTSGNSLCFELNPAFSERIHKTFFCYKGDYGQKFHNTHTVKRLGLNFISGGVS